MKPLSIVFCVLSVAFLAFAIHRLAGEPEPLVVQIEAGPPQPKVSPGEAGIDPVALAQAVEYAGARDTRALLVGRGGHLVFEKYWGDTNIDTPVELSGFTPVLAAIAVGTAINERLVGGIDMPVAYYLPGADGAVTIRQLLSRQGPSPEPGSDIEQLARLLEKVTGQRYDALIAERLWRPLGAGDFALAQGVGPRSGQARADCCLRARLGDWMRVGELLANDGVFQGNQFAPPRYVTLMLTPTHEDSPVGFFTRVDGTFATQDVARLEADGAQRLWVVPSLKLVILRVGGDPGSKGWDEAVIPDTIIRGTSGWQPAKVGEGVDPNKYAPH
jgi:CubicO group peptidase (beta-lactamase class C family)